MATSDNAQDQTKLNEQLKSIVYGDAIKNKYGTFRCFCSTISDESQIENIVNYLRKNISFHRLNKFSHAYRISHYDNVIESYYNDARLEGCGEKLLHLLQKFNVENVLLVIGVDKKDTFGILSPEYYHTIIERAKDLLSTLYEKVIENDFGSAQKEPFLTSLQEQYSVDGSYRQRAGPAVTYLDSSIIPEPQVAKKMERPNHFLSAEQRQHLQAQKGKLPNITGDKEKLLQSVLKNNLKRNFEKIKDILDDWHDNDYQHFKFICLYDKHQRIAKVFRMLMILEDIKNVEDLAQIYDFKEQLPALASTVLSKEKCKKISDILRQDKLMNPKGLARDNPVVASLLEYITILVRNYELSERILELEIKKHDERRTANDLHYSKLGYDIEEERNNIVLDLTKDLTYPLKDNHRGNMSYEIGNTLDNTTEGENTTLPRVNNILRSAEKDTNTSNILNKESSGKKSGFVARGMASIHNSSNHNNSYTIAKHERLRSNPASLSEDQDNYLEPRMGGQTPVEARADANYDSKPMVNRPTRGKSPSIGSEKGYSNKEKGRNAHDGTVPSKTGVSSSKEYGSGGKPPIFGSKQMDERSPKRNNSPVMRGVRMNRSQDHGEEEKLDSPDDIPDDPDEIRRYLELNPIEGQTDVNLEVIADKLTKHRTKHT